MLFGASQVAANAERIANFLGRKPKSPLFTKTRADKLDSGAEVGGHFVVVSGAAILLEPPALYCDSSLK